MANISTTWKALSGHDHWEGLLSPLDISLRNYIIHYGELAQVTYDAFIKEKPSKYVGLPRYNMKNLFTKLGLQKNNNTTRYKYNVTKYVYAISALDIPGLDINMSSSNWMGYVAAANDETATLLGRRDIVVAWRGTQQPLEWVNDVEFLLVPMFDNNDALEKVVVHSGFYLMYTSTSLSSSHNKCARDQVLEEVRKLVDQYKDEEISITVTGHSLGAALATLCAYDIVANKYNAPTSVRNKSCLVTAIVFGGPRVENLYFKKLFLNYDQLRCLRVQNFKDMVPTQPLIGYHHVGELLAIDTRKSPYLKPSSDPRVWHNLEVYLHGVAGTRGEDNGEFKLVIDRDISLVNKRVDMLKDEYLVPQAWWVQLNKGMVQQDNGNYWKFIDVEIDELDQVD